MAACKYGDPLCPCQDGDMCHYEGDNPMIPPLLDDIYRKILHGENCEDGMCFVPIKNYIESYAQLVLQAKQTGECLYGFSRLDNVGIHNFLFKQKWIVPLENKEEALLAIRMAN
jgi:hypothetical protein